MQYALTGVGRPTRSAPVSTPRAELVSKTETSPLRLSKGNKKAARRSLKQLIQEHQRHASAADLRAVAVTLTYRDPKDVGPNQISDFLDPLRRKLKDLGHSLPYVWVLESASHIHYHLILWLPRGYRFSFAQLAKWWRWGSTWLESCRVVKAWGRYLGKFQAGKARLPKGSHKYGGGGLDAAGKEAILRARLPRWLAALLPPHQLVRRALGGGWVNPATGEYFKCPYTWTPRGIKLASTTP